MVGELRIFWAKAIRAARFSTNFVYRQKNWDRELKKKTLRRPFRYPAFSVILVEVLLVIIPRLAMMAEVKNKNRLFDFEKVNLTRG